MSAAPTSPLAGKAVLVTGGAGFLGRHVCAALNARGVRGVVVPRSRDYDLRRPSTVADLFAGTGPDVVIHLAAHCGGIGLNRRCPGTLFYDNLTMGANVIHEARLAGVGKVVVVGTCCSYPESPPVPFREDSLWDGYPESTNAPYGIAKRVLLTMLEAYRAEFGLYSAYLIPANLYGPGDNFDPETSHVIPALVRKFTEAVRAGEKHVTLWGTGAATRDFLYVEDAAAGIVAAAERYDSPEPVNLGTEQEVSIRNLASLVARLCGYGGEITWDGKLDGQPRRVLDTSRAVAAFGWCASTPLEVGLRETVEWWRQQPCAK